MHRKRSTFWCIDADRFDEMNDDEDRDDSEPKAKATPRAKKSKTNADEEEKKPRAPGKPVRYVSQCAAHPGRHQCAPTSAQCQGNVLKHSGLLQIRVLHTEEEYSGTSHLKLTAHDMSRKDLALTRLFSAGWPFLIASHQLLTATACAISLVVIAGP